MFINYWICVVLSKGAFKEMAFRSPHVAGNRRTFEEETGTEAVLVEDPEDK